MIALDLPGFGRSPMPTEPISISGYARMLDVLLGKLGVDAAAVVGNSMGGFIAAELAIDFPQRVERLVLVSPAGLSTYRDPRGLRDCAGYAVMERPIAAYRWLGRRQRRPVTRRPGLRDVALGLIVRHADRLPAPLAAEQIRGGGKPGFAQALAANLDYDFRRRLPEIACPTLIVWGAERPRYHRARRRRFTELIPGSRKVIYEDTGHMSQLERPAEFNALLAEFLERVDTVRMAHAGHEAVQVGACATEPEHSLRRIPSAGGRPRRRQGRMRPCHQGAHARPGRPPHAAAGWAAFQRATAPSAALPTSLAYLAIATSSRPLRTGGV